MAELRHFSKDQAAKLRALMDTAVGAVCEGCRCTRARVPRAQSWTVLRVQASHAGAPSFCRATLQP